MDIDGRGTITQSNLSRILNNELNLNVSEELIKDMIDGCDFNQDGSVDQEDFVKLMKKYYKLKVN